MCAGEAWGRRAGKEERRKGGKEERRAGRFMGDFFVGFRGGSLGRRGFVEFGFCLGDEIVVKYIINGGE